MLFWISYQKLCHSHILLFVKSTQRYVRLLKCFVATSLAIALGKFWFRSLCFILAVKTYCGRGKLSWFKFLLFKGLSCTLTPACLWIRKITLPKFLAHDYPSPTSIVVIHPELPRMPKNTLAPHRPNIVITKLLRYGSPQWGDGVP